jgi:hypothetical protein
MMEAGWRESVFERTTEGPRIQFEVLTKSQPSETATRAGGMKTRLSCSCMAIGPGKVVSAFCVVVDKISKAVGTNVGVMTLKAIAFAQACPHELVAVTAVVDVINKHL